MVSHEVPPQLIELSQAKQGNPVSKAWTFTYPPEITEEQLAQFNEVIDAAISHYCKELGVKVSESFLITRSGGGWNAI